MKWLIGCLVALFMVAPAFAGEDPYIAVVGNDINANLFYVSPKHYQFLYNQLVTGVPLTGEGFTTDHTIPRFPELCDLSGVVGDGVPSLPFRFRGVETRLIGLQNSGWYQWAIRLPKKPNAINICFECGVVKPNTFAIYGFSAVELCAANTGERQYPGGICARDDVNPGQNPIIQGALPKITATVSPGPNNSFAPFNLTAYRNPGTYDSINQPLTNNRAIQVLDGSNGTRVMLKSCLDKCINIKIPVEGQLNALGQSEFDLEMGDLITIRMDVPRANTVDIYCGAESARLTGIGEAFYPIPPVNDTEN